MAVFVLVHGGFHGGWCRRRITPRRRLAGYDVRTPTLTGLGERAHLASPATSPDTHIRDVLGGTTAPAGFPPRRLLPHRVKHHPRAGLAIGGTTGGPIGADWYTAGLCRDATGSGGRPRDGPPWTRVSAPGTANRQP
jgi:hypothetical protein